ncbi:hypothetical protein [Desulfosediminicola flagellatus]|uniref:hypothetical protein n=1 Tax=Desulfosediminicola flagellatus TaxID=2569541 RepID=UPI0010AD5EC7|nr:hypothetical protein [Desulfosediminicola flagellatus]
MGQDKRFLKQTVSGILNIKEADEIRDELSIKIAIARNCRILQSKVFHLKPGQNKLEYNLKFKSEGSQPMGVRVLAGANVSDEALRSTDHHQVWVKANTFKDGVAKDVELAITDRLYRTWLRGCRTYTLRGRVVCRRWVWDPIEQTFVICDAPVRGAEVTAFDVDRFWWWYRRDEVGSDFTDLNGNFEIKFTWCCWWWRPWFFKYWRIDPDLVGRIQKVFEHSPIPLPLPEPVPDFSIFERMVADSTQNDPMQTMIEEDSSSNFVQFGEKLVAHLPDAPELRSLHVWPWYPLFDCTPDIVFKVRQDCGEGEMTIYSESSTETRWNIPTELDGVVLVANEDACCGPFCCSDPPDDDCLALHGVGCFTSYPFEQIEQNLADPLVGYAQPGTNDRPFGGTISIRGVFGDGSAVDFYKPQRRRLSPSPTGWTDMNPDEVALFKRGHWIGPPPPFHKYETVKLLDVDSEQVLKTISRYRAENPDVNPFVDPSNSDILLKWKTADDQANNGAPMPGLQDGVYELRFIGYSYDAASDTLKEQQVMPLCAPPGEVVDPALHATIRLRLDNRVWSRVFGSVHLNTTEPDCDFPNICAIVVNENPAIPLSLQLDRCVDPCGVARVKSGDTLTIHFNASDTDGHLERYSLHAHWAESDVFNILAGGTLAGDPDLHYGPTYNQALTQGLPGSIARPHWYGGNFKVTVPVDGIVPGSPHKAFETCCAFLIRLKVWKRTTNGCTAPQHFHTNWCEFSFTVLREDLVGHPDHTACSDLCPPEAQDAGNLKLLK